MIFHNEAPYQNKWRFVCQNISLGYKQVTHVLNIINMFILISFPVISGLCDTIKQIHCWFIMSNVYLIEKEYDSEDNNIKFALQPCIIPVVLLSFDIKSYLISPCHQSIGMMQLKHSDKYR